MNTSDHSVRNDSALSWSFLEKAARHLDESATPQNMAHLLHAICQDVFCIQATALFYRKKDEPVLERLDGSQFDSLSSEHAAAVSQSSSPGTAFHINDTPCQLIHLFTASHTELLFIHTGSKHASVNQIETFLRLWALRWEKGLVDQEKNQAVLQLSRIRSITDELSKNQDYNSLLSTLLKKTVALINADQGWILISDESSGDLRIEAMQGDSPENAAFPLREQAIQKRVMRSRQPAMTVQTRRPDAKKTRQPFSMICVPLIRQGQAFGVIFATSEQECVRFTPRDLDLVCILSSNAAALVDQARLFNRSITDCLTGLYIRRYFMPKLELELKRTCRYGTPLSLIVIDADHFKQINDTYGHQAGDNALRTIASILRGNIRTDIDLPVRLGGEEFAVLLPETREEGALILAERIRKQMESTCLSLGEKHAPLTLSVGVACAPFHGSTSDQLFQCADRALYTSKQQGRNRVTSFSALRSDAVHEH